MRKDADVRALVRQSEIPGVRTPECEIPGACTPECEIPGACSPECAILDTRCLVEIGGSEARRELLCVQL